MSRWKWQQKSTGEAMTVVRVEHYLTRDDIAELLCARTDVETGTRLSQDTLLHYVRLELAAATVLEPVETWPNNYTEEEAGVRREWAWAQAQKFYESTSGIAAPRSEEET
jgi:hypothetical protein